MTEIQAPYAHQQEPKKVYIAGPITGVVGYKENFNKVESVLASAGHLVMNPAVLPEGFEWEDYMAICIPMLTCCEYIVMLDGWQKSQGARVELIEAVKQHKIIVFESELEDWLTLIGEEDEKLTANA